MKRIAPALLFAFTVACGSSTDEGEPIIRNFQVRTAEVVIETFASSTGTIVHGEGILPVDPNQLGCGEIMEVGAYRTDSEVVFRIEIKDKICFGNDVHEVVLNNIEWKGERGRMIFSNLGDPSETGKNRGAATFVGSESGLAIVPEIQVTQWMNSAADLNIYMSVPLAVFSFIEESDDLSVFDVQVIVQRLLGGIASHVDATASVNVDFVDLP